MPIALTPLQRSQMEEHGYTVIEDFLQGAELARVVEGMQTCPGGRGAFAQSETVRDLMDHPRALELVVDCAGWNIQCREAIYSVGSPGTPETDPEALTAGWHHDYEEEFQGTTADGKIPLLDFKVSWYLSDHTERVIRRVSRARVNACE